MKRIGEGKRFLAEERQRPLFIVSTKSQNEPAKKLGSGDAIRAGYIFECFTYRPRNHGADMEVRRSLVGDN